MQKLRVRRAAGVAAVLALAVIAPVAAQQAGRSSTVEPAEEPGARGAVAGHVPSQREQAQDAPVRVARQSESVEPRWWDADQGGLLPAEASYPNAYGRLTVLNTSGPIDTTGHPFFTALGPNGRACVTCHQPADGMSVSPATLKRRWVETRGKDPVFAAVDGSNCPSLPQGERTSHSLLLDHGLFRIFLPWPPRAADGSRIEPEFDIEVVRDPTRCNTDPLYGLKSDNPMVSIFRRPRPVANAKYLTTPDGIGFNVKTGMPLAIDPDTGRNSAMQLMADSRHPGLKTQAVEAAVTHLQTQGLSKAQIDGIFAFENQIFLAQTSSKVGVDFSGADAPPGLNPHNLARARAGLLGNDLKTPVFQPFDAWKVPTGDRKKDAFRASVVRGADVFMNKHFLIRDTPHLNTVGLGNPIRRTCTTCHNAQMSGMDVAPGWMDIGVNTVPTADPLKHLPLFKITCKADALPHPFLGRVIYTHDPGRALISGQCVDVGSITMQQFRGLAARPPYFANGSAKDLMALVEYYDRRYDIGYTRREKQDLVNFMSVL